MLCEKLTHDEMTGLRNIIIPILTYNTEIRMLRLKLLLRGDRITDMGWMMYFIPSSICSCFFFINIQSLWEGKYNI